MFGPGSGYLFGEDTVFLADCFKKGLSVYTSSFNIGTSTKKLKWFEGYNDSFFVNKGAIYKHIYGVTACVTAIYYAKKYEDAEMNLLNALHVYKKLNKPSLYRKVGNVYYWLSKLYFEQGEYVRPEKYLLKALEFYKGCDDKDDEFLNRLGLCYNNLAYAYKNQNKYSEAEAAYIEAYQFRKDLASRNPEQYNAKLRIACERLISFYELIEQPELKNKYVEELGLLG
jgi:tetratricopeptide (TPR) repeat protein